MKEVVGELVDFIISSNYAHAALVLVLFLLGARVILFFFKHVLERLAKKTPTEMDDRIVVKMETPVVIIMILVGIQLAAKYILLEGLVFANFINSAIIIIVTAMFIGITDIVITYWAKNRENEENEEFHQEVQPLVKSLSKMLFVAIGIVAILQMWGVQVGTTLASLGILGVVLGFAFQDTMKNIFGGISLIVDDSLHKKDVIRLDTGETGEVVEVNLRSTKIRTFDNEYLIIPNGLLSNSKIINLAEPTPTLRIDIPVSVAYGSDPEHVKEVLLGVLSQFEEVLKFPKREVRFIKMNEFSLDFMVLFFISNF
ncbi:MAG: mechanosensitive ion channel family protein, partial [Nanoarchaeota archaeon]|nr:mechanosensitive ion channel family protein [Nanoarchaeota archaeon]